MPEATDADLVLRSQVDSEAFGLLWDRYHLPVYRFCARRLESREAAEDATSAIFTKAFSHLGGFDTNRGSFQAWLFTIARNELHDQHRRARPFQFQDIETLPEIADGSRGPAEIAVQRDEAQHLGRLIDRLSPEQREVIELRLAGLTATEIAGTLGLARNTVDARASRAIKQLRAALGLDAPEGRPTV